jgi:hypothetical protein
MTSAIAYLENKVRTSLVDGSEPWPLPTSEIHAVEALFARLGLQEKTPDGHRTTKLGDVMHLDLLMVFLSVWDEGEVPGQLLRYGLISEGACERLLAVDFTYADLKPLVRDAYVAAQDRGLLRLRLT